MCLSNLYVSLKRMEHGVAITASSSRLAIFSVLAKLKLVRRHFGLLENNIMQSVASAAGMMTGGGTVAAIPAWMMITGQVMAAGRCFLDYHDRHARFGHVDSHEAADDQHRTAALPFGCGRSRDLESAAQHGQKGGDQARLLGYSGLLGAVVAFIRDARFSWLPFNLPEKIKIRFITLQGRPLVDYTLSFEGSLVMIGAGGIMGFRAAWSMLLGAIINFGILAPYLYAHGNHPRKTWATKHRRLECVVWLGNDPDERSACFCVPMENDRPRDWQRFFGIPGGRRMKQDPSESREVPMLWFLIGCMVLSPIVIFLEWLFSASRPGWGYLHHFELFYRNRRHPGNGGNRHHTHRSPGENHADHLRHPRSRQCDDQSHDRQCYGGRRPSRS